MMDDGLVSADIADKTWVTVAVSGDSNSSAVTSHLAAVSEEEHELNSRLLNGGSGCRSLLAVGLHRPLTNYNRDLSKSRQESNSDEVWKLPSVT